MPRELRRLLITPGRCAELIELTSEERHYLQRVLRLRDGDPFAVVDGAGHLWQAVLQQGQAHLSSPLERPDASQPPPRPRLRLAVALPRRDGDVLLRMATELGIDQLQPLQSERSVQERWNRQRSVAIVREAMEQCERLWLPELADPAPVSTWLAGLQGPCFWATTRQQDLPRLAALLAPLMSADWVAAESVTVGSVTVAIGPEGGWSPAEEELAANHGCRPVQLGATILRCSTAAVAAATLLCSWRSGLDEPAA